MPRRIETTPTAAGKPQGGFLDGQLLIAMPTMDDPRFAGTLVYLCAHSEDGAMGIVINREAGRVNFPELLAQLNVLPADARIELAPAMQNFKVLRGGPVETRRGFVLHSSDYHTEDSTLTIDDTVSLTATVDILKAIATGEGPRQALLALGYAGWGPGQLETEIQGNGWLHCAADPDLVFAANIEAKYAKALGKLGIAPGQLSPEAGHA